MGKKIETAIVFDFDGTIADSTVLILDILYEIIHHEHLPDEDMSRLRGMSMMQMLSALQIPWWRAHSLMENVRTHMTNRMNEVPIVPGLDEAIRTLQKRYKIFILTSNSTENVRVFLRHFGIEQCFLNIYDHARPLHKEHRLRNLIRQNSLQSNEIWYVCDEPSDIKAAKRAGIKSVAVTWGYSNIHVLKEHHPDALVFSPDELISCFSYNA